MAIPAGRGMKLKTNPLLEEIESYKNTRKLMVGSTIARTLGNVGIGRYRLFALTAA